jgi:hypothetical protein
MKGLVKAFAEGRLDISDDLVFPSDTGTPIEMDNFAERVFKPLLTRAGLRKVPFTTCAIMPIFWSCRLFAEVAGLGPVWRRVAAATRHLKSA